MPAATVTSKGQITIPREVRHALRLGTGQRVAFIVRDDGVVELRPETVDLKDLYGLLKPKGKALTIEQMSESIGAAVTDYFDGSDRE